MNLEFLFLGFYFVFKLVHLITLAHSFINFNQTCTSFSFMYTAQVKLSSGLSIYTNVLEEFLHSRPKAAISHKKS